MELPDNILLQKISQASVYLDKLSFEKFTGTTKPKYKLARNKILEDFLFNILTTTKDSCNRHLTLKIKKEEWAGKVSDEYLCEDCSYCDVSKYAIHSEDELLEKIKDKKNGFPYVALLPESKYIELIKLCKKAKYIRTISNETKEIIDLSIAEIADDKIKDLGLD